MERVATFEVKTKSFKEIKQMDIVGGWFNREDGKHPYFYKQGSYWFIGAHDEGADPSTYIGTIPPYYYHTDGTFH